MEKRGSDDHVTSYAKTFNAAARKCYASRLKPCPKALHNAWVNATAEIPPRGGASPPQADYAFQPWGYGMDRVAAMRSLRRSTRYSRATIIDRRGKPSAMSS